MVQIWIFLRPIYYIGPFAKAFQVQAQNVEAFKLQAQNWQAFWEFTHIFRQNSKWPQEVRKGPLTHASAEKYIKK